MKTNGFRHVRVAMIAVGAIGGLLAGCTKPPPTTGYYQDQARQVQQTNPDARPWFCNAAGNGTPLSGHGNGHQVDPIYEGKTKGPLSWADCLTMSRQLDVLWNNVRVWDTRGKAEAAGWFPVGDYTNGLGTHHTRVWGASYGFDTANPNFLIYGGTGPDAPLVGVAWAAAGGAALPAAFAGENDWWHRHAKVCFEANPTSFPARDLGEGEELSDERCAELGGIQVDLGAGAYLLHLWLNPPYEYRLDQFASGHNCLLRTGVAPQTDPCWEIARRDPALGLPPGSGDPHGGEHGHP